MKNTIKTLLIIFVSLSVGFGVAKFNVISGFFNSNGHQKEAEVYLCPMHPTYISDRPGDCPICAMRLVKKEKKEKSTKVVHRQMKEDSNDDSGTSNLLDIDPTKQQYIGIKTVKTKKKSVSKEIKVLGTVVPDETKITHVHTKFSGFIEEVFADYEGKLVKKGQPLFTVYSPELVSTQEEYLLALEAQDTLKESKFDEINKSKESLLGAAKRRLELWDISPEQIEVLEQNKKVTKEITFYSPADGFITQRNAFEGHQITPKEMIYDIADLSNVWIFLEVFEVDLPLVTLGQTVTINFPYENIKALNGKITYIYPSVDPMTRNTKVRVEANNPGFKLKPDMYVDATILSNIGSYIVIPTQAAIDSGEKQIVFVKTGSGSFEPRAVKLGPEINDERVIYSGLEENENVVVSGNFLLDSESNLQTALDQMKAGHEHKGH